ncbi:hypothetical protein IW261DRAFT_1573551 [Armillaria novae-zelandiae]|uniref:Uncharacterized protein n=1 Tax=Armillaria novae-zelandiae TaxID=153914 RepID=A0AA39NNK9_9AGAR|nr:hypothetical protein IW261DRAFT_1573551 [Armillaria novae-zelandiae]
MLNETYPYIPSRQVDTMEPMTYPGDTSNRQFFSLSDLDFMNLSTRQQVNDDNTTVPPAFALFSHHGGGFLSHLRSVSDGSSSHCPSGREFDEEESEIDEDDGSEVNGEAGDSETSEYSHFLEGLSDGSRINILPQALSIIHEVDDEDFTGAFADREESTYTLFEELGNEGSEIDMSNCAELDEVSSEQFLDLDDHTDFLMDRHSIPLHASAVLPHNIYGKSGSEIFKLCDDGLFARDTNPGESNSGHSLSQTSNSHQVPSMHHRPSSHLQKTSHANRDRFRHSTYAATPQEDVEDFASAINARRTGEYQHEAPTTVEIQILHLTPAQERKTLLVIFLDKFHTYVTTLDVSIASEARIQAYEHTLDLLHGPQPEQGLVLDTSNQNIATPWNMRSKELLLDGFLESGGSSLPNVAISVAATRLKVA